MLMRDHFKYDVFLRQSAQDKAVVRPRPVAASRPSATNSTADPICDGKEDGGALPRRRYVWAHAFGPDSAKLETGTCGRGNLPFREPMKQDHHFIPRLLHDDAIKGFLALFSARKGKLVQQGPHLPQDAHQRPGNHLTPGQEHCQLHGPIDNYGKHHHHRRALAIKNKLEDYPRDRRRYRRCNH